MRPLPLQQRFLSLTLALLVLVASVGLPVQRRTCLLSGRSTAHIQWRSTTLPEACPAANAPLPLLRKSCYAYSLQLHQLSTATHTPAPPVLPVAPVWVAWPQAVRIANLVAPLPVGLMAPLKEEATGMPPPRPAGRQLLTRVGCWLV